MLDNIQNIDRLDETPFERFTGTFLPQKQLSKVQDGRRNDVAFGDNVRDKVELTVYDLRSRTAVYWEPVQDYKVSREGEVLLPLYKRLRQADLQKNVDYGLRLGFRRKIIHPESLLDGIRRVPREERLDRLRRNLGANIGYKLFVDEISRDRREVRLRPKKVGQPKFDDAFREAFVGFFGQDANLMRYALNFGRGEVYPIVNWTLDQNTYPEFPYSVVVKTANEVSNQREQGDECWADETVFDPTFDKIVVPAEQDEGENLVYLSPPNYNVDRARKQFSETGQKSWDDLLTEDAETTEQLLERFLENRDQVQLNVDYSEFENFAKFSSVEERVLNFQYKYELLFRYTSMIDEKTSADNYNSTPRAQQKVEELRRKRTSLVEGFDGFEQYIYNSPELRSTGDLVDPSSAAYSTFFEELRREAKQYDDQNPDMLRKQVPDFVRGDSRNDDFTLFVDMMGQYFDQFWLYIKHIQYKSDRSEDITDPESLSKDLTKFVAESFGYELYNGFDLQDLYQYAFSSDVDAQFPFADAVANTNEEAGEIIQKQVWRRVLNNIPYVSKAKGTRRSIRALMNTYGIPRIGLTIREFGGGSDTDAPGFYEVEDISHALAFARDGSVTIGWNGFSLLPESFEIRFRTQYQGSQDNVLFSVPGLFEVAAVPVPGKDDRVREIRVELFTGESVSVEADVPVADGEWNHVAFEFDQSDSRARLQVGKLGSIGPYQFAEGSDSEVTWYESEEKQISPAFASGYAANTADVNVGSEFLGDTDLFRVWEDPLDPETFQGHALAPMRYDTDNTDFAKSYSFRDFNTGITRKLQVQLEFTEPKDLTGGAVLENQAPETDYTGQIQASGFPVETERPWQFKRIYRTNYLEPVKSGADVLSSDKIRFQDTFIAGQLSPDEQREIGDFDRQRRDSSKLGVYFDPKSGVNEDIIASIGIQDVNSLLAYPEDRFQSEYDKLEVLNTKYWKKYDEPVDVQSYIQYVEQFNRAFFKQLEEIVPARVNLKKGLLLEPHLLERNKFKQLGVEKEEVSERTEIDALGNTDQTAYYFVESDDVDVTGDIKPDFGYILQDIKEPVDVIQNDRRYFGNKITETRFQTRQSPGLYPDGTYFDPEQAFGVELTVSAAIRQDTGEVFGSVTYSATEDTNDNDLYAVVEPDPNANGYSDEFERRVFVVDQFPAGPIGDKSFVRTYESHVFDRRIPFPAGGLTFVTEIWESTDIFHTTFFQSFGSFNTYFDGSQTNATYGQDSYSSQNAGGEFIFTAIGRIPTPERPYRLYRHYIFNREFRSAKKNQLYEGMVYDSSVEGRPAVELTDVEPERLIVSESDRDRGEGPIVDVE